MRFRVGASLLVAVVLPALAACKTTPKERLEGRWIGERADNFHPSQAERAAGWVSGASFEFKGSRVTVSIPAESPREGTFKITHASEQELRVTFLRPQGAEDQVTFMMEGDDRLRWMLGDGSSILLRKVMD